jgi:hypothetical protein
MHFFFHVGILSILAAAGKFDEHFYEATDQVDFSGADSDLQT